MTPEHWQRVKQVLEPALEVDPTSRSIFLDRACAGDDCLRREVESLISYDIAGANVLQRISVEGFDAGSDALFHLAPGKRVGAYEIIGEIGFGGMGAVYRAARADGQYKQQVALKIVRADLGSLTAERFRNERQILASLDHPNIARILDGGATIDGLPYLVMELIDGLPITDYCDQHKLSIDERLKMFRAVCSAVQYAHQHLVIHRDIKPANILVTHDATPKLLDFGIAKILDPNLLQQNQTLTAAGLWMMTPEYASPEQFLGETVTTSTDVYSLGLVLYELLTGHRAYRLPSHMPHEVARIVLETDPEKPSAAITRGNSIAADAKTETYPTPQSVSQLRASSPQKLQQRLRGDLDNIVLKAIRREPPERYSSADQLSDDVRRYLEHLPVLARKSTLAYRCRKYVLRHKAGVAAAALVVLSLLTGLTLAWREARIAQRRFNDVRKVANSLIFEVHDSIRALPGATAARKLILQRAQEYLDNLAKDASSDPDLLRELAGSYERLGSVLGNVRDANLGDSDQALRDYRRAVELREAVAAARPSNVDIRRELAESYMALALALGQSGQIGAQEFSVKALSILEPSAAANPGNLRVQYALAKAYEGRAAGFEHASKWPQAVEQNEKSLAIYQRLSQADPKYMIDLAFAHKHIGADLTFQKQWEPALQHERAALAIDETRLQSDPHNIDNRYAITFTYSDTGFILGKQGDVEGALRLYQKAFDMRKQMIAADPQDTRARAGLANTYNYIARLLWQKGDLKQALEDEKQALSLRQTLAENDAGNEWKWLQVAFSQGSIGETYARMAFQPHVTRERQSSLCRAAESWLQKALPEIQKRKNLLGGDTDYPIIVQHAIDRCRGVLSAPE